MIRYHVLGCNLGSICTFDCLAPDEDSAQQLFVRVVGTDLLYYAYERIVVVDADSSEGRGFGLDVQWTDGRMYKSCSDDEVGTVEIVNYNLYI